MNEMNVYRCVVCVCVRWRNGTRAMLSWLVTVME